VTSNVPSIPQGQRTLLPVSKVFDSAPLEDLGEGIRTALAQLSINQNVFGVNHRGVYEQLPTDKLRTVEVVIVKSAKSQSKAFWPGGFTGGNKGPACWSSNSLTPDPQVPTPVSKTCSTCPNDVFITSPNGMKQKPCGDHKRLAIVPADDITNETYGGCMIFRVPAGSLGALDKYGSELKKYGIPYYAYTTFITITIDPQKKVTKLLFEPGRPLTDEEALLVKELREDEKSGRIVNESIGYEAPDDEATPDSRIPSKAAPVPPKVAIPTPPTPAARPVPPAPPTVKETISEAVSKPATPPPSQRTIVTEPIVEEETSNDEAGENLDELFNDLVKRT
jgi:hypothetical protein